MTSSWQKKRRVKGTYAQRSAAVPAGDARQQSLLTKEDQRASRSKYDSYLKSLMKLASRSALVVLKAICFHW
jgi:hypothetical protein